MVATITALTFVALSQKKHIDVDTPAIKALYPKINRACEQKDMRTIDRMLSRSFVEETPMHKKLNKTQFLGKLKQEFGPVTKVKMNLMPLDVQVKNGVATVEVRYTMTGKMTDKAGQHAVRSEGSETHGWKKMGRSWMCSYIKEHEWTYMVDGRVVQHEP